MPAGFDLLNLPADFVPRAYDYFKAARAASPACQNSDGSFVLTRYDDIVQVYRDPGLWSSDKQASFKPKFGDSPLFEHHTTSLVFRDAPDHTRIRKVAQSCFGPRRFKSIQPQIEGIVRRHLD